MLLLLLFLRFFLDLCLDCSVFDVNICMIVVCMVRRGYAAATASQGVASSAVKGGSVAAARNSNLLKKSGEEKVVGSSEKVSWVPDPVTGYYRPENRADEIDVAELRSVLLNNRN